MAKAVYSSYRACNYNPFEALAGSEKKDLATEHKKLVERDGVAKVTTSYARAAFPGLGPQ
jgi:hypothetical protein